MVRKIIGAVSYSIQIVYKHNIYANQATNQPTPLGKISFHFVPHENLTKLTGINYYRIKNPCKETIGLKCHLIKTYIRQVVLNTMKF